MANILILAYIIYVLMDILQTILVHTHSVRGISLAKVFLIPLQF